MLWEKCWWNEILIFGWEVEEKKLEAELYYKIVGNGGAIIKNL
jgi:hypothetical protein